MKVAAISMVRNEGDVIEAFVRHHAETVDELVVVDQRSSDGTDGILAELAGEGLPLRVVPEESRVFRQSAVMTRLMREAAVIGGAAWVLPLDGDEFLVAAGGNVRKELQALPPEQPLAVDMRPYVPTAEDPSDQPNPVRRIRHRRPLEHDIRSRKVIVPHAWACHPRYPLRQGNHGLIDARTGISVPSVHTGELALAHFPVRSPNQIARKVLGGWPAHLARPDRRPGAFQWKRAFDLIVSGRPIGAADLEALAFDYPTEEPGERLELIFDPVPAPYELRYPVRDQLTPLELLAETAVELAEELCVALRDRDADPRPARRQAETRPRAAIERRRRRRPTRPVSAAVGVVIPTYNRLPVVRDAVASVLGQTFEDFELTVVDDGSTDGTCEALTGLDPRLRCHRQENQGPAAARNAGIRLSEAPLIAFLDDDNRWLPDHLGVLAAVFARHPRAVLASTCPLPTAFGGFFVGGEECAQDSRLIDLLPESLLRNPVGLVSCVGVRREALLEVGGFDEEIAIGEEEDLFLRLAMEGPFATVRRRTIVHRSTPGGLWETGRRSGLYTEANRRSVKRVIKQLERRPGAGARQLLSRAQARLHIIAAVAALERRDRTAARRELTRACARLPELERNPTPILRQLWFSADDHGELRWRVEAAADAMPDPEVLLGALLYFRGREFAR